MPSQSKCEAIRACRPLMNKGRQVRAEFENLRFVYPTPLMKGVVCAKHPGQPWRGLIINSTRIIRALDLSNHLNLAITFLMDIVSWVVVHV